jgi:hypothetical protein
MLNHAPVGVQTALAVLEDNDTKKLVIERKRPEMIRSETQPRAHQFFAVDGFIEYVKLNGKDKKTVVFADHANSRMYAVLDDQAPKGAERIALQPQIHPRWEPWRNWLDRTRELDQFVDFLRQNRRTLTGDAGRDLTMALSQVKASTEVELNRGRGKKALNGLIVRTKITGGGANAENVELPDTITINTPIFVDTPPIGIELDLILEATNGGKTITAALASADIRDAEIAGFDAMWDAVQADLGDKHTVVCGKPEWAHWKYDDPAF